MIRNPIQAKNEIVRGFISETDIFLEKYKELLKKLGFEERGSSMLNVGSEIYETEPWIEYSHNNKYGLGGLTITYNIFTKRLYYVKQVIRDKSNLYSGYLSYQLDVNNMTCKEFEAELREHLNYDNLLTDEDETDKKQESK
jgi:hypothetical protein